MADGEHEIGDPRGGWTVVGDAEPPQGKKSPVTQPPIPKTPEGAESPDTLPRDDLLGGGPMLGYLDAPTQGYLGVLTDKEVASNKIRLEDAEFRRSLAKSLFFLFALVVLLPLVVFAAIPALSIFFEIPSELDTALQAIEEYYPAAITAVTGVFASAIGFYFGAISSGK